MMMNYSDEELEVCPDDANKAQFILRLIVLGMAFCSSFFIGFHSLLKIKYWTFQVLFAQSCFECIDLGLAIVFNQFVVGHDVLNEKCKIVGYIMHTSWLSSFSCSFLMIFFHKLLLKADGLYTRTINSSGRMSAIFLSITVLPYIWLLCPMLYDMGPTGWYAYEEKCKPYFFCGFKEDKIFYTIFWTLPIVVVFVMALCISYKNQRIASVHQSQHYSEIDNEELSIIQNLQKIPAVYAFFWGLNLIVRYLDFFPTLHKYITTNMITYVIYVVFNIIFEFHLCIILYLFVKYYGKILKIKEFWVSVVTCSFQKKKVKEESLLYEDLNSNE